MDKLNVNLNLYRSFYYVAKYNGFTKASQYANLSQSSLSSNIKTLEESLNVKLFDRKINNIVLTKAGNILFEQLKEITSILKCDFTHNTQINIRCLRFIADNYLADAIEIFKAKYPNIVVNISFENSTNLYQMMRKDEVEIVICRYPLFYKFDKNISVIKICDVENTFVCSKEFYLKNIKNKNLDGYIYPLILPDSSEKRRTVEKYLIDNNIKYKVEVELPNSQLLKKLILKSVGIGYINKKAVKRYIESGDMIEVKSFNNIPIDNITIIYNSKVNNELVNNFLKVFKDTIDNSNN